MQCPGDFFPDALVCIFMEIYPLFSLDQQILDVEQFWVLGYAIVEKIFGKLNSDGMYP
jgi:hypothetical protein